jgi:hypothetical protein
MSIQVINQVSFYLGVEPATTAANIVTGADSHLTCKLLQHLAIAVKLFTTRASAPAAAGVAAGGSSSPANKPVKVNSLRGSAAAASTNITSSGFRAAWPVEVKITFSKDGDEVSRASGQAISNILWSYLLRILGNIISRHATQVV